MRFAYTVLLYLLAPFVLLRLLWRSRELVAYRQRIGERFGFVERVPQGVAVWVHAVSVGETVAALPLIQALLAHHGEQEVWVTTMTPTGSARVRSELGDRVRHSYIPYDLPGAVARFLDRAQPRQVVVMETELWPNLFRAVSRRGLNLVLANARLSPRSFRGYSRLQRAVSEVLADCTIVAAQSDADAERFRALGAQRVTVMGNIKFDLAVPDEKVRAGRSLRQWFGTSRPVWIAASTHEGEDQQILAAHQVLLETMPEAALILVPRHPQRFDATFRLAEKTGLAVQRRTGFDSAEPAQILVGDSMGEMFVYFGAADVAFVGGSLARVGGHNVLEPAAIGLPVLFGPHMFNFLPARELLLQAGAAIEIADANALADALIELLGAPQRAQQMGQAGRQAVEANRGALVRLLQLL
jgi:3-deoxy-D-manno-octulosonic-acid transferase